MLQRRALELLNCATVGLIGYYLGLYLYDNGHIPSFKGITLYLIVMFFIFLTMHSMTLWFYKKLKNVNRVEEFEVKKQFVLLDLLEKQTRNGLSDDPYTKALQNLVVTEVLTPKSSRKHKPLKKSNSADSHLLQNGNSNQQRSFKMWSSLRKVEQPVNTNITNEGLPMPAKLKPAPPPPTTPYNRTPVAIHQSLRMGERKQMSNKETINNISASVQRRIEELNKNNSYSGYENHALAVEEKSFKSRCKPFR